MKLILWDWNGTLVNDAEVAWGSFNDLIQLYGYDPISFERYQAIYRHPIVDMYHDIGFDMVKHDFNEVADRFHHCYVARAANVALHHDTVETLNYMAQQGKRQAILSALPHEILPASVKSHGIDHFFESIHGLEDKFGHSKVELGHRVVRDLGVGPDELIIVGDSSHDAEVARSLKARCVLVARGLESRERLAVNGVPVLESFERLPDYLTSL